MGQMLQHQLGPLLDLLGVALAHLLQLARPFRVLAARPHLVDCPPQMAGRLELDALFAIAAMIDVDIESEFMQPLIGAIGPVLAPFAQQVHLVPLAHLASETFRRHLAHGQHHMRVRIIRVPVDVEIRHHSAADEFVAHVIARQPDRVGLAQLLRQGKLDLACDLRIPALLPRFDRIPQPLAIVHPRRCAVAATKSLNELLRSYSCSRKSARALRRRNDPPRDRPPPPPRCVRGCAL